ncbi:hypothetical protein PHAVU_002G234308 [Phaseolus vulgaris]
MAKLTETKFTFSETLKFEPNNSDGPVYVTVEKVMDAYSGCRELIFFVPFIYITVWDFPCVSWNPLVKRMKGDLSSLHIVTGVERKCYLIKRMVFLCLHPTMNYLRNYLIIQGVI